MSKAGLECAHGCGSPDVQGESVRAATLNARSPTEHRWGMGNKLESEERNEQDGM